MSKITIDDYTYEVHELTDGERYEYLEALDEFACEQLNPWEDLHQKICGMPEALQAAIFGRMPCSLFPLSVRQMKQVAMSVDCMSVLAEIIVDGQYVEGHLRPDCVPVVTEGNRFALFALLQPFLTELVDEPEGQRLTGQAAVEFVQRAAAAQQGEVKTDSPPASYRPTPKPPTPPINPPAPLRPALNTERIL